ncbi:hypothetical protein ACIBW9_30095 [Streptomyces sp. NPDC049541]|uniref:hypothetical protein n=1 Tax=Streptomyces sp. NPDC049541 TaxID=3365594 RepID=UPI00378FB4A8
MSQPPFQPPPQPPQPPQNHPNPYAQPLPPQQPGFGPPAPPGQHPMYAGPQPVGQPPGQPMYPMQPTPPFQAPPFGQRPHAGGHAVGAVFLRLLVSFVVSALYTGLILATYKDITSATVANALSLGHALLNGAIVGALVGKVGRGSNGARIGGAVIAALGAFFGDANALPLIIAKEQSFMALKDMLEYNPFLPAKAWWHSDATGGVDWFSLLSLVLAAGAAWGVAYLVGSRRRPA